MLEGWLPLIGIALWLGGIALTLATFFLIVRFVSAVERIAAALEKH
jgi:hypothetical protein